MKVVANIQLKPTEEQAADLRATLERCNEACNWLSDMAFESKVFGQYSLQKLHYRTMREQFGLTAQAAVRCIAKVADAYKLDKKTQRTFRKHSAQPYDDRIIRFMSEDRISIWLLPGRAKIPFVMGEHQMRLMAHRKGEVDLVFFPYDGTRPLRGRWFLTCVIDGDPEVLMPSDTDLAYFAGLFDGEGCISMTAPDNRIARLSVKMTICHSPALIRLQSWFGGNISKPQIRGTNKTIFTWTLGSFQEQLHFLDCIAEHLDEKQPQANLAIEYLRARIKLTDRSRLPEHMKALAAVAAARITSAKK